MRREFPATVRAAYDHGVVRPVKAILRFTHFTVDICIYIYITTPRSRNFASRTRPHASMFVQETLLQERDRMRSCSFDVFSETVCDHVRSMHFHFVFGI